MLTATLLYLQPSTVTIVPPLSLLYLYCHYYTSTVTIVPPSTVTIYLHCHHLPPLSPFTSTVTILPLLSPLSSAVTIVLCCPVQSHSYATDLKFQFVKFILYCFISRK